MSVGDYIPFDVGAAVVRDDPVNRNEVLRPDKVKNADAAGSFLGESGPEIEIEEPETLATLANSSRDEGLFPDYGKGADFRRFQASKDQTLATLARNSGNRSWASGLARLVTLPQPSYLSRDRWEELCFDAVCLDRDWGDEASLYGWSVEEMFGINSEPWKFGVDAWGLCPLLHGRPVVSLDAATACIDVGRGYIQTFRRAYAPTNPTAMWDAFARESGP